MTKFHIPNSAKTKVTFNIRKDLLGKVDEIADQTNNSRNEVLNRLIDYAFKKIKEEDNSGK